MMHLNTELLTDYWRARRPAFGSPPRSSIDPTQFVDLLPQVFMLGRAAAGRYSFRLVGALLADLHGRGLQGDDFLSLWTGADRASLKSAMEGAARRSEPLVVDCVGRSQEGQLAQFEILLAPVAGASGAIDRFLGLYQPLSPLVRLEGEPVAWLSVQRMTAGQSLVEAPHLRLAALDGRLIA